MFPTTIPEPFMTIPLANSVRIKTISPRTAPVTLILRKSEPSPRTLRRSEPVTVGLFKMLCEPFNFGARPFSTTSGSSSPWGRLSGIWTFSTGSVTASSGVSADACCTANTLARVDAPTRSDFVCSDICFLSRVAWRSHLVEIPTSRPQ